MVTDALHNSGSAGVAHAETLASYAVDERFTSGCTVQGNVANDNVLDAVIGDILGRVNDQLAAGKALAHIVVGIANQFQGQASGDKGTKALAAVPVADHMEGIFRQGVAKLAGDLAAKNRAERAVGVANFQFNGHRLGLCHVKALLELLHQHAHIRRFFQAEVVNILGVEVYAAVFHQRVFQQGSQVHLACAGTSRGILDFQQVGAANQFIHGMHAQAGHVFAQILGHKAHKVDDVFRLALKALAQLGVLGADAQRAGAKAELFSAQHGGNGHIAAAHQLAVSFNAHAGAQAVHDQALVCFGKAQLPRQAGIVDGVARCSAGAAVKAGNQNHFGTGLGNAGGNGANTGFADQLDVDGSLAVGAFQVIDQLGQVLNGVDIMVRRGRDQAHAGGGVTGLGNPGVNLAAGQLAALAGLCALCHFDLNLTGGNQILAGHAKTGGCHLLDGAVALGAKTVFGFAAFAGVALAADAVHGNGHALVGFLRKGTIAHGSGLEAVYDGIHAFHFVQRDTGVRIIEVQQAAQVHGIAARGVHGIGISLELVVIAGPAGLLQQVDGQRVVQMIFGQLAAAELVLTQAGQLHADIQAQRVECLLVAGFQVVLDVADGNAAHTADGVGKVLIHYLVAQTQRFKNLAALVGLDGGNAHLGGNLDDAGQNGFIVVVHGGIVIFVQQTLIDQLADSLLCQIGVDGAGTVAQQGGKVVHLPGLGALQNQCQRGALFGADEVLGHRRHRQQAGDGHMVLVNVPVGQDDDVRTLFISAVYLQENAVDGLFEAGVLVVVDGDSGDFEARDIHVLDAEKVSGREDGIVDLEHLAVFGLVFQQVAVCAHIDAGGGDDLLADGVDGRVRHLCKTLLEIIEERRVLAAEDGKRGIGTHCAGRLCALTCHGQDEGADVLILVAEHLLQAQQVVAGVAGGLDVGDLEVLQLDEVAVYPLAVRLTAGVVFLQLLVVHDFALDGVHQQHLAGAETVFDQNVLRLTGQHAHLGREDHPAVFGDVVAAGAQTVAVQYSAYHVAIGEEDGGGAVPGFQHGGVILVEVPLFLADVLVVLPGFRDGDHDSQRQVHAVHHHELEGVVQHGGVGAGGVDDGQDLVHVLLHDGGGDGLFTGQHGVGVALDGVDLAVVQDKAVGVCTHPAGVGVGRKAAQIVHKEHTLIHDGAAGQAGHISAVAGLLKHAAHDVQAAVKLNALAYLGGLFDEALPDGGHTVAGFLAHGVGVYRHFAPCQKLEALFAGDKLKKLHGLGAQMLVGYLGKEAVADLQHDAHAVAGLALGVLAGAVLKVLHDGQRVADGLVALAALDVHDGTDAAGVVLELGVIEAQRPFLLREIFHRLSHPFFDFPENILAMLRHIPQSPS